MTFLGKVLVVTQILFSFVFMAFAGAVYSKQSDWKKKHDTERGLHQSAKADLSDERNAREKSDTLFTDRINNTEERAKTAESGLDATRKLLDDERKRHETTTVEKNDAVALAQVAEQASIARREEAILQRDVNEDLQSQSDELVESIQQLNDQIFDMERADRERADKHIKLLKQVAFLEQIVRKNNLDTSPEAYVDKQLPPPAVDGVVRDTSTDKDRRTQFVEISLGSDDGLAIGHQLFVTRGSKYLGKIQIRRVTSDHSVGTVIQRAKNGIIEEGDHVSSKL